MIKRVNSEIEKQFIEKVRKRCSSTDYERNGCELDEIITEEFIHEYLGCKQLSQAIRDVECWRA